MITTILITVMFIMAHMAVGLCVTRNRLALAKARYEALDSKNKKTMLEDRVAEKKALNHDGVCQYNYPYTFPDRTCSCRRATEFNRLNREIRQLKDGMAPAPRPNYSLVVTWPFAAVADYVKDVEPAYSKEQSLDIRMREIEALEKKMGIGQ